MKKGNAAIAIDLDALQVASSEEINGEETSFNIIWGKVEN